MGGLKSEISYLYLFCKDKDLLWFRVIFSDTEVLVGLGFAIWVLALLDLIISVDKVRGLSREENTLLSELCDISLTEFT